MIPTKYTLLILTLLLCNVANGQIITTIAGNGGPGCTGDGGSATDAEFSAAQSIAIDSYGNVYIDDRGCYQIRKIDAMGTITLYAGNLAAYYSGDGGPATLAGLYQPTGIAVDRNGNLYIADDLNDRVRKVDPSGIITTFAGTGVGGYNGDNVPATDAKLAGPHDIVVDDIGNVYIGEFGNRRVRKVDTLGIITTLAVSYSPILGVAIDRSGNLYFSCWNDGTIGGFIDHSVWKVNTSGTKTKLAGSDSSGFSGDGGPSTAALLSYPYKIAVDRIGNVYIADAGNNRIRRIDPSGIITTFAGNGVGGYSGDGGPIINCELAYPTGLAFDSIDNLYIVDLGNHRIRYINSSVFVNTVRDNHSDLKIYPNPCSGEFSINIISNFKTEAQITITTTIGQKLKEVATTTNTKTEIILDVPPGIYFVTTVTEKGRQSSKIIVR